LRGGRIRTITLFPVVPRKYKGRKSYKCSNLFTKYVFGSTCVPS